MPWSLFLTACGLLLVFEGVLPFLSPKQWKIVMQQMQVQNDRTLRIIGLMSMLLGLVLVTVAHYFFIE